MDIDEKLGMHGILSALLCLLGYPNRIEVSCASTAMRVKLSSEIFRKLRARQTHSQTFHWLMLLSVIFRDKTNHTVSANAACL